MHYLRVKRLHLPSRHEIPDYQAMERMGLTARVELEQFAGLGRTDREGKRKGKGKRRDVTGMWRGTLRHRSRSASCEMLVWLLIPACRASGRRCFVSVSDLEDMGLAARR